MYYYTPYLDLTWVTTLPIWWLVVIFIICVCSLVGLAVVSTICAMDTRADPTKTKEDDREDW